MDMLTFAFVFLSLVATGLHAFSIDVVNPALKVKENEGVDMKCIYSADFGASPRVEWKFKDVKGSQGFIFFDGKPTGPYADRITVYNQGLRFNKVTRADTGDYDCEVYGSDNYAEKTIKLTVLVPPGKPIARIPPSVTTGSKALLTCFDVVGSPPSTYKWYKNDAPLPEEPSKFDAFRNLTYKMNTFNGNLEFQSVSKIDIGAYYCEAGNSEGTQRSETVQMDVRDVNVGGIVAGVIVALLAVGLLLFALWYANKKGFLPKMSERKPKTALYTPPRTEDVDAGDGEFRQKSSFVV